MLIEIASYQFGTIIIKNERENFLHSESFMESLLFMTEGNFAKGVKITREVEAFMEVRALPSRCLIIQTRKGSYRRDRRIAS